MTSTEGGILIPRLTESQRDAIAMPATGLMIYQTNEISGFYFYNGTAWTKINGATGPQGVFGDASFEYKYDCIGSLLYDVVCTKYLLLTISLYIPVICPIYCYNCVIQHNIHICLPLLHFKF